MHFKMHKTCEEAEQAKKNVVMRRNCVEQVRKRRRICKCAEKKSKTENNVIINLVHGKMTKN